MTPPTRPLADPAVGEDMSHRGVPIQCQLVYDCCFVLFRFGAFLHLCTSPGWRSCACHWPPTRISTSGHFVSGGPLSLHSEPRKQMALPCFNWGHSLYVYTSLSRPLALYIQQSGGLRSTVDLERTPDVDQKMTPKPQTHPGSSLTSGRTRSGQPGQGQAKGHRGRRTRLRTQRVSGNNSGA